MTDIGSLTVKLIADIEDYKRNIAEAKGATDDLAQGVKSDVDSTKKSMDEAGQAAKKQSDDTKNAYQGMKDAAKEVAIGAAGVVAAYLAVQKGIDATVGELATQADAVRTLDEINRQSAESNSRLVAMLDEYKIGSEEALVAQRALANQGESLTIPTLEALSEQYLKLGDGQERQTFLTQNFGRASAAWAEVMTQGAGAIQARSDAVDKGMILDQAAIDKARAYEYATAAENEAIKAARMEIGEKLAPVVTYFLTIQTRATQITNESKASWMQYVPVLQEVYALYAEVAAVFGGGNKVTQDMTESTKGLNTELEKHYAEMDQDNTELMKWNGQQQDANHLAQLTAKSIADEAASVNLLAAGLQGTLQKAWEGSSANLTEYTKDLEYWQNIQLNGQGMVDYYNEQLQKQGELYGKNSDEYRKANKDLDNMTAAYRGAGGQVDYYNGKLDEETAKIDAATRAFLYQQIATKLTGDAALVMARNLGLLSETDYAAAQAEQALTKEYDTNHDGIIDLNEAAGEYGTKIRMINDAIDYAKQHNLPITQQFILDYVGDGIADINSLIGYARANNQPITQDFILNYIINRTTHSTSDGGGGGDGSGGGGGGDRPITGFDPQTHMPIYGQAEGGDYFVTRPTLFLAGDSGAERATFTPLNNIADSQNGKDDKRLNFVNYGIVHLHTDGQDVQQDILAQIGVA